jgi:hypothetical protein
MASQDIDYLNNLNLNGNQLKNVVIQKVATLPTSTDKYDGKFVYLTTADGTNAIGLYFCKSDTWTMLGTGGDVTVLAGRVEALETTVGDASAGLVHDVADIESKYASKVSATAGTGLKTTINSEGIVTAVTTAGTSDLSDWSTVDAGLVHTADLINTSAGSADAGKAIKLNSQGKIDNTMIPPLAIAELAGTVDAKSKLTTLSSAEKGDIAVVDGDATTNNNGVYFLTGAYDTLANWVQIVGPANVVSVNGSTGVVTIGVSDLNGITQEEIDAIDSGITASKVSTYDGYADGKINAFATAPSAGKVVITKADTNDLDVSSATLGSATKPIYLNAGALAEGTQIGDAGYLGKTVQGSDSGSKFSSSSTDSNVPTDKAVYTALETKVDKVTGYSLVDDTEITKLSGIEAGAEVNVIETVKVNGTALTPDSNRAVDVTVPTDNASLANGAGYQTASDVATAIAGIFKTATVTTTANTDTTVTGVTAGKTPKFVQVLKNGVIVQCYVAVASGSITINTASAQTGLTVNWIE